MQYCMNISAKHDGGYSYIAVWSWKDYFLRICKLAAWWDIQGHVLSYVGKEVYLYAVFIMFMCMRSLSRIENMWREKLKGKAWQDTCVEGGTVLDIECSTNTKESGSLLSCREPVHDVVLSGFICQFWVGLARPSLIKRLPVQPVDLVIDILIMPLFLGWNWLQIEWNYTTQWHVNNVSFSFCMSCALQINRRVKRLIQSTYLAVNRDQRLTAKNFGLSEFSS